MFLKSIEIRNYKSIEQLKITIDENSDKSFSYGIIGENEAGKSSILKAIALTDNINQIPVKPVDFGDKKIAIIILFEYILSTQEEANILSYSKNDYPEIDLKELGMISLKYQVNYDDINSLHKSLLIKTTKKGYLIALNVGTELYQYIDNIRHKTVFWNFDDRYLISKEINLASFFTNPEGISIPLKNCFKLAGYKDQLNTISSILTDSTERENLREVLSEAVTNHIKRVWKKHKVKITFDITPSTLNFHIKDEGSRKKAKTIEQRSDGFKQFISFLLTISAENVNSDLKDTILLLDEPETHLHPKAQEDLLLELVELTKRNNNLLFFATHSNYMIDKNILERNLKVFKNQDVSAVEWFKPQVSTYASINYDVFGVASSDYHNELYDLLRDKFSEEKNIDDLGINKFDEEYFKQVKKIKKEHPNKGITKSVTLPTFIRNCIHYPQNKPRNFEELLMESIDLLRGYLKD